MKVKDDLLRWRDEIRKLNELMIILSEHTKTQSESIDALSKQVETLVKLTEDMTEAMLSLIRLQMGD